MKIKLQWKLTAIFCLLAIFILAAVYIYVNSRLRLVIPVSKVGEFESGMQKILAGGIAAVFLISPFFSLMIFLAVTRPLAKISSAVKAIGAGDFSGKLFVGSRDEIGDLAATLNYVSDEIKSKMEKIESGEAKLETVLSGMVEGVIVTDAKGKITLANPSLRKLFFIDTALEGKMPLEVIRNSSVQNIVDRVLKSGQRIAAEEITVLSPEEKFIKVSGVAIMKDRQLEGAIFVFHDISELRRLERVRQDFVANVSHELRTPLSSIKGYSETLLDGGSIRPQERKEFLDIIYRESDRLARLINDLLDLSKIESGKMSMVFIPIEIKPLVKRSVGVIEKSAREKSIKIEFDIPDGLPKVMADENRLSQVFLNLIDNAVKYTPEGGSIRVSILLHDKYLQADISDTGIGIPQEDLPRVFERFYRVDKARSRQLGGTGLGLSIVKHIIQGHGGQVWVKSEFGRGSTFSFTVPAAV